MFLCVLHQLKFESLVNTEGFKTDTLVSLPGKVFESLVNTEGFKTGRDHESASHVFESLVNTEGFKTTHMIIS